MAKALKQGKNESDDDFNARVAAANADLGDLTITADNEPSHPNLQANYIINGQMYGLKDILKAVAGDPDGASPTAYDTWNGLDNTEKLTKVKEYLVGMEASPAADEPEAPAEKRLTSMESRLARLERNAGLDRSNE